MSKEYTEALLDKVEERVDRLSVEECAEAVYRLSLYSFLYESEACEVLKDFIKDSVYYRPRSGVNEGKKMLERDVLDNLVDFLEIEYTEEDYEAECEERERELAELRSDYFKHV